MRKLIIIPLFYLFLPAVLTAQPKQEPEALFNDALFFYQIEDYKEAAFLFQQLTLINPENANFNFYAGMSLLNVKGQERKAIPFIERAVMFTGIKTKIRSYQERRAPHHAWFYLGNAYRINNQLDKALDAYHRFQNIKHFERHYNLRILENEIKACSRAKIIQDTPLQLKIENLGEPVNTSASDYNAVLSADEKTIVYISSQRFYEAIMHSTRTDRIWNTPVNITSQVGSDGDMFPTYLTPDGKTLYLVKKTRAGGDIHVSYFDGTFWSKAQALNGNINTRADEAHASLSPDGRFLYFSSNRKGGYGGLDLYVSEKQSDEEWGPAVNLGSSVNTPSDEDTPFISSDGNFLYFSSTGHFNMGGYDIFFSRYNADGTWGDPINIGYPINTTNDDKFFFPADNDHSGYISIYDDENGFGMEDIFRVKVIPYSHILVEPAKPYTRSFYIKLTDKESGEVIKIYYDSISDIFRLKPGTSERKYMLEVEDE